MRIILANFRKKNIPRDQPIFQKKLLFKNYKTTQNISLDSGKKLNQIIRFDFKNNHFKEIPIVSFDYFFVQGFHCFRVIASKIRLKLYLKD